MTRRITWTLGLLTAIVAVGQVGLDADPLVLLLALASVACGLYGFWLLGVNNLAAWASLAYMSGNVLIAMVAKTVLLQPLESNLRTPLTSFGVQAICGFAMLTALIVAVWPRLPAELKAEILALVDSTKPRSRSPRTT